MVRLKKLRNQIKMANNVKLKDSSPISNNLTDIAVGGEDSCLAISKDSGIRVKGGVDASGDLKIGDETFINLKKDGPIDVSVKNWQGECSRVRFSDCCKHIFSICII